MNRIFDLVIIGAGPAGMTAAIYASRAGLSTLMIDASAPGGQLLKTYLIDNYPGIPSVPGPDLAIQMYEQSISFGAQYMYGYVEEITKEKKVKLQDGSIITAKAILIATGSKAKQLGIPGEQDAIGHGESFCAVCDGAFFRNKQVVVIGGGDSALEEAQFLTRFASSVTIVIRRDVFRATEKAQQEVEKNDKIHVIRRHIPKEILLTDGKVSGIVLENTDTHDSITIPCEGVFPYIGHTPETAFAKDLGIMDQNGYILTQKGMATGVPGIYAAGDCTYKELRQVVTACGDGARAATQVFHSITGF